MTHMTASMTLIYVICVIAVVAAFAFTAYLFKWVKKQPSNNRRIEYVADLIQKGANAFMRKEYLILARFAAIAALAIFVFLPAPIWSGSGIAPNLKMALTYIAGTVFSAIAGKIGIIVATNANVVAGMNFSATLTNDYAACENFLSVYSFNAETFCVAISAVFGTTATFVVRK